MLSSIVLADVTAVGLMPGMAILEKQGQRIIIKSGQTKQGITLIQADSNSATIELNGRQQILPLGASVASGYAPRAGGQVRIAKGQNGQYFTDVRVNGQLVNMLVDTGASHIALSEQHARQLGIDYSQGQRGRSSTAGGIVNSYRVQLNQVTVGEITRYNVQATVVQGNFPSIPLLGMSFLNQLSIKEEQGMLMLSE